MGLKRIVAHRQSSEQRENDPGPDIWYHVGQWAINNLGLTDGGPGYKIDKGNAIPDLWRKWGLAKPQPELEFGLPLVEFLARKADRHSPDYIRWVQQSLNRILGLQLAVDGDAREKTKNAIFSFQTQRGLPADGIIGAQTEAALIAALAGSLPSRSGTAVPPSPAQIKPPTSPRDPQQSTFALVRTIPDDPDYQKYIPFDYVLNAKEIVGQVAQDLNSRAEHAHFILELTHAGVEILEIFDFLGGTAAAAGGGLALALASPLIGVALIGLGLGAPYYALAKELAEEWSAKGFSRGVVMGADGQKPSLLREYFGHRNFPPHPSLPNGASIKAANYRLGLIVGYAQGRLLSKNQRAIFWHDLGSRMGYQSYRGPSKGWSQHEWADWYDTAANFFNKDHLEH